MAEEKDMTPPEAPESAEAAETADEQVAETETSGQAETPAAPEPVEEAEPVVEETPAGDAPVEATADAAAEASAAGSEPAETETDSPGEAPDASDESDAAPAAKGDDQASEAGDSGSEEDSAQVAKRRRTGVSVGIAHIRATFNNTLVSISDMRGGVISWSSAGRAGFKGSRKSTAFAATMVGQDAARQAVAKGMHEVEVHVQGAGSGRESAIRALQTSGLVVTLIKDVTPMPHNGCRQRKRRRV